MFVLVQIGLLVSVAVTAAQGRGDWPTPAPVRVAAALCTLGGLVVVAAASLQLGRALTATPLPNGRGSLRNGGLYRVVRHPIYSGVLLIVIGLAVRSASWVSGALAAVTIVFFNVKALWEERRLSEAFDGYAAYAAVTPRFVPRPPR
jgi:protein-S-isoprenylcysteine O-methyltransferase Ste14